MMATVTAWKRHANASTVTVNVNCARYYHMQLLGYKNLQVTPLVLFYDGPIVREVRSKRVTSSQLISAQYNCASDSKMGTFGVVFLILGASVQLVSCQAG